MRRATLLFIALSAPASLIADPPPTLPDGPGKATFEKVCGNCHGVEVAISRRETKDGWNAIIDDMIQRGAEASDDEFGQVADYLSANFSKTTPGGKVNVNTSNAKELAAVLEISADQAAAIVKYRNDNGLFHSAMDLAKAPGMDAAKVDAKKDRLTFASR
jgi:competence ComEA-like helix-hairpin-helix protein